MLKLLVEDLRLLIKKIILASSKIYIKGVIYVDIDVVYNQYRKAIQDIFSSSMLHV